MTKQRLDVCPRCREYYEMCQCEPIETEAELRSLVEEELAAIDEGAKSRFTNGELDLMRRASDELEQAKQTAEELSHRHIR